MIEKIDTPDPLTAVFHLKESYASFLPITGPTKLTSRNIPPTPLARKNFLDAAGYPRAANGIRFHLTLKTSTEEQARLIGAALQEQWRKASVDLELRPLELATLLSDSIHGNFQLTFLRWVGANNGPDVFEFVFSSKRFPPDGANRGHYRNPRIDALTDQIRVEMDQEKRKALCSEAQKILADDLPYIPMWSHWRLRLSHHPASLIGFPRIPEHSISAFEQAFALPLRVLCASSSEPSALSL